MDRFVVVSGCSSGGKSTLIAELGKRGHAVVDEPGRRIVKEELARGGSALPWADGVAFARRAMAIALADRAGARSLDGWVFFDRGLIDAAAALEHMTGKPVLTALGQANRYHRRVFLAPPWPEIYETDPERRHGLSTALAEYSRLIETYPSLGYEVLILPKVGVSERADFILNTLEACDPLSLENAWIAPLPQPTPRTGGSGARANLFGHAAMRCSTGANGLAWHAGVLSFSRPPASFTGGGPFVSACSVNLPSRARQLDV